MKDGPNIARIAGVTKQTTSAHLSFMEVRITGEQAGETK
jgi:hypothetical protein